MTSRYTLLDRRGKPVPSGRGHEAVRVPYSTAPQSHYQRLVAQGFRVITGTNFLAPAEVDWIAKRPKGASPSPAGLASMHAFQHKERFPSPPAPRSPTPSPSPGNIRGVSADPYMPAVEERMDGRGPPSFGAPFSVQTEPRSVISLPESPDLSRLPRSPYEYETVSPYDSDLFAVPVQYPSNPSSPGTVPPTFEMQQRHLGETANELTGQSFYDPFAFDAGWNVPLDSIGMATSTYQERRGRSHSTSAAGAPRRIKSSSVVPTRDLVRASKAVEAADVAAGLLPADTPATQKAVKRAAKLAREDIKRAVEHKDPIQSPIPAAHLKKIEQGWNAKKKKPRAKKPPRTKKEARKQLAKEVAAVVEVLGDLGKPAPTKTKRK